MAEPEQGPGDDTAVLDEPAREAPISTGRAAGAWRSLLAVLVPVLVPFLLIDPVLRTLLLRHDAALVDGRLRLDTGSWLIHLPLVVGWCWAVTAGTAVTGAARAGVRLRPATAIRLGLRGLPLVLLALAIATATVALEVWTLALVSEARVAWLAALIAFLLVTPFVLARLALVAPASVLGGLPPGATFSALALLVLGVALGPAALLGAAVTLHREVLPPRVLPAGVTELLWHVVLVLTAALQAAALGRAFTAATGPDEVRRTLSAHPVAGAAPGLLRLAALALPAALVAALTLVNPYRLPPIAEGVIASSDAVLAVGWPAGRAPVIAGAFRVHDCLDDTCHHTRDTPLFAEANRHASAAAAAVAPDGTVTYVLLPDNSYSSGGGAPGPALLTRCDPARRCDTEQLTLPGPTPGRAPTLAAATAPDGALLVATVRPLPGGAASELALIRCPPPPPAANPPASPPPGSAAPGGPSPGAAVSGAASPGAAVPGTVSPGATVPGATVPGGAVPGGAAPGSAAPGSAAPGSAAPGSAAATPICATPKVTVLGTAATQPPARDGAYESPKARLLSLSVDDSGAPWVALREANGPRIWLGTCAAGACAVTERHGPPQRGGPFTVTPAGGTVHLGAGRLRHCTAESCSEQLLTADPRDDDTTVVWANGAVYALVTEPVSRLGLGNAGPLAGIRRPFVVRCAEPTCRRRQTVALAIPPEIVSSAWLAVDPGGRVVVVHDRSDTLTVQTLRLP
ncbi:hypothetical protein ACFFX1_21040 [Dactylosporangium sucinum]|uniref:hypothetical protein n=1 Tax=Dactylosporangium sucinum TaxID=1424081 RepID=UPI00167D80CC|nr:hypothetical protein [Dactylosporangium sucinum]